MTNIITACFGGTRFTNTRPAWLIDHGMVLQIKGVELPETYEVDFSNSKAETATRVLGNADGVVIPDQYFLNNAKQIYAWVYLTTGDSGFTTLQITIPLTQRPDVSTEPPTPQETDLIEQAIAALNDGVERAETAADDAEAAAANIQQTVNDALQAAKDSGEFDGTDGVNGVTFTPDVDAAGNISWTNDGGLPNPQTRNIKGPKGDKLTYADLTAADKADLVQGPIADAQTAAVNAVNSKGEEVIQSIPSDYTELSEDVDDLKSALDDVEYDVGILKSFHKNDLTWAQIKNIVQTGHAQDFFQIGDQIEVNWTKGNTVHKLPFDVVSFEPVLKEGVSDPVPGLWLQSHYAMDGVQFGASRAAYYCQGALPAGTYVFQITTTWSQAVAGYYQFTTTQDIPAGGQIVIGRNNDFYTWAAPDTAPANWKVHTFSTVGSTTPLEMNLAVTAVESGTPLFTLSSSAKYNANGEGNLQSCGYGYNRWSFSSMRKWLNSDAVAGQWWVASDNADRPAQQLATLDGFMKGFESDFLSVLGKIKVTTALNTASDTDVGASEDTYDTFFLPSLEQEYIVPQASGVEGAYWPYWKERLGLNSPQGWYGDNANVNHIRYAYDARTSAQYCRLRSALRGGATYTWLVYPSGYATSYFAASALRGCPACVIC